jgi:hypothetical protein
MRQLPPPCQLFVNNRENTTGEAGLTDKAPPSERRYQLLLRGLKLAERGGQKNNSDQNKLAPDRKDVRQAKVFLPPLSAGLDLEQQIPDANRICDSGSFGRHR